MKRDAQHLATDSDSKFWIIADKDKWTQLFSDYSFMCSEGCEMCDVIREDGDNQASPLLREKKIEASYKT